MGSQDHSMRDKKNQQRRDTQLMNRCQTVFFGNSDIKDKQMSMPCFFFGKYMGGFIQLIKKYNLQNGPAVYISGKNWICLVSKFTKLD